MKLKVLIMFLMQLLYDEFQPNLVIADNMPVLTSSIDTNQPFSVNDKASGLEIVKYIKQKSTILQ
jgi:hypothetical protein